MAHWDIDKIERKGKGNWIGLTLERNSNSGIRDRSRAMNHGPMSYNRFGWKLHHIDPQRFPCGLKTECKREKKDKDRVGKAERCKSNKYNREGGSFFFDFHCKFYSIAEK